MIHDESHSVESKTVFGFWLYILSDVIMFSVIFAAYAVLRNGTAGAIDSSQLLSLPRALAETLLLLVSSFTCGFSQIYSLESQRKFQTLALVGITFILGSLFVGMVFGDLYHLVQSGNSWQQSAFLSAYFLLIGTLLMHLAAGLLWMIVLMVQIWQRGMIASTHRRMMCLKMFWHFLNIVWVGVYSWIYLMGAV
jgi:cytochrome o ubiquinol oxidase subunit 3